MAMGNPDQAQNERHPWDQEEHPSLDPWEPSPRNSLPLAPTSIPWGIHVSPFNLAFAENRQPVQLSGFDDPLYSRSVPSPPLPEEGRVFPTECSREEPLTSSMTLQDNTSFPQPDQPEGIFDTNPFNELSQPPQLIQLPMQISHQPQQANFGAIQSRKRAGNSMAYYENGSVEASPEESGLMRPILAASYPLLQRMGSNVQPTTQTSFGTGLMSGVGNNFASQQMHMDQAQPSSSFQFVEPSTVDLTHPHISAHNPFDGNEFAEYRDLDFLQLPSVGLQQHIPTTVVLNHEQNLSHLPQRSRSQNLSRPGQIYERVSRQTQVPLSSAAMQLISNAGVNQLSHAQSVAQSIPPFSHSTSTHQFVPIQPAPSPPSPVPESEDAIRESAKLKLPTYDCVTCGKTFKSKKDMHRHVARMHILKGRHPCPDASCNQSFAEAHKLKRHFRTVHLKSRPFKCPSCESAFGEKGNLAQHYRKAHGGESSRAKRVKRS